MRKRLFFGPLSVGLVAMMLPGAAAAEWDLDQQACLDLAQEVMGGTVPDFDEILVGDAGDDDWGQDVMPNDNGKNDLVCGYEGDDYVHGLGESDVFIGGKGDDLAMDLVGDAVFFGGKGFDVVAQLAESGVFHGGRGNDTVNTMGFGPHDSGTFDGGKALDTVLGYEAGTCLDVEVGCP